MSNENTPADLVQATQEFNQAHVQALRQDRFAGISGRENALLNYEDVRKILEAREGAQLPSTQEISLDKIVGSVGRYQDFNKAFLPRNAALKERWGRVNAAMSGMVGVPPIELYKVGDLYFVRDGNHRVSVARSRGDKTIESYVTQVEVPFPVEASSADELSQWLTEAGHRLFLQHTHLDELCRDADLRLTEPGRYRDLYEQIDVHRYYLGVDAGHNIKFAEAVVSWYETVYLPLAAQIAEAGILSEFPDRTEADLFLWICRHREELNDRYDVQLNLKAAVSTFASTHSDKRLNRVIKGARLAVARLAAGEDIIVGMPHEDAGMMP